jgi:hypothetical protein
VKLKTLLIREIVVKRNREATSAKVVTVVTNTEVATNIKATTKLVTTSTVRATRIIKATDQKIKATLLVQKRIISRKTLKDLIVLQIKTRTIKIIKTVNKIKKLTLRVN